MTWRKVYMEKFVAKLAAHYPHLSFLPGETLCWSPRQQCIFYDPSGGPEEQFGLLHEVGHAMLGHNNFADDIDLLTKELEAWEYAKKVALAYKLVMPEEHIQLCLDSYRDWLHRRSCCPVCGQHGVQQTQRSYSCLNCRHSWKVSSSRLKRLYRRSTQLKTKK